MSESPVFMPTVTELPWRISHQSSTMQSKYFVANVLKYFQIYADKKAVNCDKCMAAVIKQDELF